MMARWKKNRNADLGARNAILLQQLEDTREECASWKWVATRMTSSQDGTLIERTRRLDTAVRELRKTETQLGEARRRLADEQGAHALTASHFTDFSEDWETESSALKSRLANAEQARAALVDQIEELRKCNDDLSREAVDRAGNLTRQVTA